MRGLEDVRLPGIFLFRLCRAALLLCTGENEEFRGRRAAPEPPLRKSCKNRRDSMPQEYIEIRGARENNLQNVSLRIPKRQITIFTGVSGSGKSSIVFDTVAA